MINFDDDADRDEATPDPWTNGPIDDGEPRCAHCDQLLDEPWRKGCDVCRELRDDAYEPDRCLTCGWTVRYCSLCNGADCGCFGCGCDG